MRDQYDNPIPYADLVEADMELVLDRDHPAESLAGIEEIDRADWYCACDDGHIVFVPFAQAPVAGETQPADCGLTRETKFYYVAQPLHRWSEEDGFYHA